MKSSRLSSHDICVSYKLNPIYEDNYDCRMKFHYWTMTASRRVPLLKNSRKCKISFINSYLMTENKDILKDICDEDCSDNTINTTGHTSQFIRYNVFFCVIICA